MVAGCLQKHLVLLEDRDGLARHLRYLRTKDGKKVDFVLVEEARPSLMIEVKSSDRNLSPGLKFSHDRALDWLKQLDRPVRSGSARGKAR
jgi:predicted AAA+ superfamily ATPase